ncbi:DUF4244 domain-containing protein [Actinomadura geliboluensis]|uniref:DUF4244 domain-containing protein n=2 Tax=Actinomadura geliboluensis TaxID=882440 RepID=A0A5S4G8T1_9ACTN|nr:DUF4244 domain-containing protein [Actinomadura geliboluensis]TMR28944.1 DUF4244 domain-containing protein [Actinomadura geliboluensis]
MRAMKMVMRRWSRMSADRGMSTAEYAVGTIAAAAFAGLLFKIVTSSQVRSLLLQIIEKALKIAS